MPQLIEPPTFIGKLLTTILFLQMHQQAYKSLLVLQHKVQQLFPRSLIITIGNIVLHVRLVSIQKDTLIHLQDQVQDQDLMILIFLLLAKQLLLTQLLALMVDIKVILVLILLPYSQNTQLNSLLKLVIHYQPKQMLLPLLKVQNL